MQRAKLRGPWDRRQIESFLERSRLPIRLAFTSESSYPSVVALWFLYREGSLWAAVHETSFTADALREKPACGFEISVNDPPYLGIRGPAEVTLDEERGPEILRDLIVRYLGDDSSELAQWLLHRKGKELALRIDPLQVSSWDYRERMADVAAKS